MPYFLYLVFIMGDNIILNLVVKMTSHVLSSRYGIQALLVLQEREQKGFGATFLHFMSRQTLNLM